jgi:hypothetical protein
MHVHARQPALAVDDRERRAPDPAGQKPLGAGDRPRPREPNWQIPAAVVSAAVAAGRTPRILERVVTRGVEAGAPAKVARLAASL